MSCEAIRLLRPGFGLGQFVSVVLRSFELSVHFLSISRSLSFALVLLVFASIMRMVRFFILFILSFCFELAQFWTYSIRYTLILRSFKPNRCFSLRYQIPFNFVAFDFMWPSFCCVYFQEEFVQALRESMMVQDYIYLKSIEGGGIQYSIYYVLMVGSAVIDLSS